jgi:hypothetical protein
MRRLYLRGHANILKRLLIHTGGLNLGLLMRHLTGVGTPRSLQGRAVALLVFVWSLIQHPERLWNAILVPYRAVTTSNDLNTRRHDACPEPIVATAFTTGC